jgi:sulfoxide reductase catalytic subunit YedY
MLIRRSPDVAPSEITPEAVFLRRRALLRAGVAGIAAGALAGGSQAQPAALAGRSSALSTMEKPTPASLVTSYCNFYEFGTAKDDPALYAPGRLKTRPWTLRVEGEVKTPRTFDIEDLLKLAPMEERVYRLRCVEAWSAVVPWVGYPLRELIQRVQPNGHAKFVEFTTLADPKQMPGLDSPVIDWPYTEGLRIDEAMHALTLLTFGMYGHVLPAQNGAPVRVVVPWKYGFKSAKSIVRIRFLDKEPETAWHKANPSEFGFYSNVNPERDHPRWSQKSERRLGEAIFNRRRPTLPFNGYAESVASLYAGMDLLKYY